MERIKKVFIQMIDGYSITRLTIVLFLLVFFDSVTTLIGYNKGFFETNDFLRWMMSQSPLLVFIHPIIIVSVTIFLVKVFYRWKFFIKVAYIILCLQFTIAVTQNLWILYLK